MRVRVIRVNSIKELREEVELLEQIEHMDLIEFSNLCDTLSGEELTLFINWLNKWGLL